MAGLVNCKNGIIHSHPGLTSYVIIITYMHAHDMLSVVIQPHSFSGSKAVFSRSLASPFSGAVDDLVTENTCPVAVSVLEVPGVDWCIAVMYVANMMGTDVQWDTLLATTGVYVNRGLLLPSVSRKSKLLLTMFYCMVG